jgi:preprotein translocase subunit SecE
MANKVIQYIKDTRGEMKHVIWPNRKQTINFTVIVIVISVIVAYFLGLFDFIFSRGLEKLLTF